MRKAVFTIVRNEETFLPIWLKYYSQFFESDDIYVLNHDSTDTSVEKAKEKFKFNEIKVHWEAIFSHAWLRDTVQNQQGELLKKYNYVLFTEVDEIVAPDPDLYKNLGEYIEKCDKDYIRCKGYNVVHNQVAENKPLDLEQKILRQRTGWYPQAAFNKTLLARIPLRWIYGFHSLEGEEITEVLNNVELYLIHLKRMDWDLFLERWEKTGTDKITTTRADYYFNESLNKLESIPERFRDII